MNPEWERITGGFAEEIIGRHRPMVQRIMARATAPIRTGRLWRAAERFFPRIARKIVDRARWSGALAGRISALSERIGRAFAISELQAEPIERVWLEEGQAFELPQADESLAAAAAPPTGVRAPVPGDERAPEHPARPEQPPPPKPAFPPMHGLPAVPIRRSSLQKVLRFADRTRSRFERVPLVGFSRPALEGLGALSPREPAAGRISPGLPLSQAVEEPAVPGMPQASIPPLRTAEARPEEAPLRRERALAGEGGRTARTVARYIQRVREPFRPIRRAPDAGPASARAGMTSRPVTFEGIVRKAPVTVGFTPAAEVGESETPVSRTLEAPLFTPPEQSFAPARWRWAEPSGELPRHEPFTPRAAAFPPESPLARKPTEPIPGRTSGERVRGESVLSSPSPRHGPAPTAEQRSVASPSDISVRRTPMRAEPSRRPLPGEPPSRVSRERPSHRQPAIPEERAAPVPPPVRGGESPAAPAREPPVPLPEQPFRLQQTGAMGRKSGPQEGALPITEMPVHRERPAAPRIERKEAERGERGAADRGEGGVGPSLPPEAAPGFAETVRARYEPPKGVRRIERVPLPVSSQRAFETLFAPFTPGIGRIPPGAMEEWAPRGAEGPTGFGIPPLTAFTPPMFISPSAGRGVFREPAPVQRVPLPLAPGTGVFRRESEPGRMPEALRREPEIEGGGASELVSALYRKPVSIGPRAGMVGRISEVIARTAEAPAAESVAGRPAEEAAPAAGQSPPAEGPDLDAIARQVYAIIRRRLTIEKERLGR